MADQDQDIATLMALADVPGALRIITSEPRKGSSEPPTSPAHWVLHDVTAVEGPNHRGQYTATSEEGDWTIGQPGALLKRLTEWRG